MSLRIPPCVVSGRIRAPPSKSHTHRAFILGALSGNGSIQNPLLSDDTKATLDGLHKLGMLVTIHAHETRVGGTWRRPKDTINAASSGTTLRLLTAIAALRPDEVHLDGSPRLRERPLAPLLAAIESLGAKTTSASGHAPVTVRGPIRGGTAKIRGDVSSQFISALLLACPVAERATRLDIEGPMVSRPYVDLTLAQLKEHGVLVREDGAGFEIPGGQSVRQRPYVVPGDYSSAAFLLVAAAVTKGHLVVDNLRADDAQGDRIIVDLLRRFGAHVDSTATSVEVTGGSLVARDVDVGECPDLFPILCVLAACARGTSALHGAPHLRAKESDRVQAMAANLQRAGLRVEELPDGLRIQGGIPKGINIESHDDHRIGMALAVLALASQGASILPDENVVTKSYPSFHNDLRSIAPEVARA